MATLTRAQMIDKAMRRLGVLATDQNATASDSQLVGRVLDSVYEQFLTRGMAPFASSAFPEWAQEPFAKVIAGESAAYFGMGSDPGVKSDALEGERELVEQNQGKRHYLPVRFRDY